MVKQAFWAKRVVLTREKVGMTDAKKRALLPAF
jgi:hypothetical protein